MSLGAGVRTCSELRLVGAGGTNKVMAGELSRLQRRALPDVRLPEPRKAGPGAIVYPFEARVARLAALYHRTSVRVLWDVLQSRAQRLAPLYDDIVSAAAHVPQFLWDGARISVYAHGVQEFAAGERQIVGTVKNGLIDAAAQSGLRVTLDPERPAALLCVRLDEGALRISVDLGGRAMNQRGYRQERSEAPLREDLAAVMLMLARYDARSEALLDPMTGAGTLAIEAACMGKALPTFVPPRKPLAVDMPIFRGLPPAGEVGLFADTEPRILANDLDRTLAPIVQRAASAAGVASCIDVCSGDFRDLGPARVRERLAARGPVPKTGLILVNPPYGERLAPAEFEALYTDLGEYCSRFTGWRAAFLVANPSFEPLFGGRPRIKKPMSNGPLRGYFLLYDC